MKLIAAALPVVLAGCCPVPPGGPTATGITQRMNLVAGARHFFDVDVPPETTQINTDLTLERTDVTLRLRQVEPTGIERHVRFGSHGRNWPAAGGSHSVFNRTPRA